MDPRLDGLFTSLEAQFGAAIDRAEEEAAADLALSFRQDRSLRDDLLEGSWIAVTELGPRRVCEVAKDHVRVEPGNVILPLFSTVFRRAPGQSAERTDVTLMGLLRRNVRLGAEMTIEAQDGSIAGRAIACGEDHVSIFSRGEEFLIPMAQVRAIRLSLGG